jgi:hypothetical protein
MKVFISWSGERSKAVAEALRYWLPKVIQAVQPWMSANDIEKGTQWRTGLANELEQTSIGIICLTPENLNSPWIHFEAGALSKQQQNTRVCTFLYEVDLVDVKEPLAQFQNTQAGKEDIRELIHTINNIQRDSRLPDSEIDAQFDMWWPNLEERLKSVPQTREQATPKRDVKDILEEILQLVRSQASENHISELLWTARLPSTRYWSGEDAQLLFDFYRRILEGSHNDEERKYAEEISSDELVAIEALRNIKAARTAHRRRKRWGSSLDDYIEPDKRDS